MGPGHKISEEKMFLAIFNYIEHLYGKIKPKKLFFMAVDGNVLRERRINGRCRATSENEPAARAEVSLGEGRGGCTKESRGKRRGTSRRPI
jgi:5'-3' exoribonuclease 1